MDSWYLHKQTEQSHLQKMDSDPDFSIDSDCDEFANEILFVDNILQLFLFKLVFTAAEIQGKKDQLVLLPWSLTGSYVTELDTLPAH